MVALLRLTPGAMFAVDFEVRELLAEGGMGTVYSVIDRTCGEARALKVLLPELVADETSRRRFAQEANVAAQIESTHVPRIYRAGIDDATGIPFIAMELLHGKDLRKHIKEHGPLSLDEARPILEQLGDALAAAHRHGLVHRDLKPENVFIVEQNGEQRVKLLDFGVAKVIDVRRTSAIGTGAIGSPLWMSPEQTSAGGRIAPSTDVFAFGLLSFYLFTGTFYWRSAHSDAGVGGLLRELHVDDIEFPSERVKQIGKSVVFPPGYDEWFVCAVARDGSKRYRDGGEALAALKPVLERRARRSDRSQLAFAATMQVEVYGEPEIEPDTLERIPRTDPPPSMSDASIGQNTAPMFALDSHAHAYPQASPQPSPQPMAHAAAPAPQSRTWIWAVLFVALAILTAAISVCGVGIALTMLRSPSRRSTQVPAPAIAPMEPLAPQTPQPVEIQQGGPLISAGSVFIGTYTCGVTAWNADLTILSVQGEAVTARMTSSSVEGARTQGLSGQLQARRLVLRTDDGSAPRSFAGYVDAIEGTYRGRVAQQGCYGFSFTRRT